MEPRFGKPGATDLRGVKREKDNNQRSFSLPLLVFLFNSLSLSLSLFLSLSILLFFTSSLFIRLNFFLDHSLSSLNLSSFFIFPSRLHGSFDRSLLFFSLFISLYDICLRSSRRLLFSYSFPTSQICTIHSNILFVLFDSLVDRARGDFDPWLLLDRSSGPFEATLTKSFNYSECHVAKNVTNAALCARIYAIYNIRTYVMWLDEMWQGESDEEGIKSSYFASNFFLFHHNEIS